MNTSMFLPQVPEDDVFDKSGRQIDDINSVVEWVATALGYDHTSDDEDDDSGQNFHLVKSYEYNFRQAYTIITIEHSNEIKKPDYSNRKTVYREDIYREIITPPPEA